MPKEKTRKNVRHETKTEEVMDSGYAWNILLAPLASFLCRKYSFRSVSFTGGLMVGCCYFLSGFIFDFIILVALVDTNYKFRLLLLAFMVQTMMFLNAVYSVPGPIIYVESLSGVGYCLSYVPSVIIINLYFKQRRTLANGIMISVGGVAKLLIPSLYRFLIDKYGLSQALWLIGAFLSNICVASCLFREPNKPLQSNNAQAGIKERISVKTNENQTKCCNGPNFNLCLFKNKSFTLLVIALTICTFGYISNFILIPAHIKTLGFSNTYITIYYWWCRIDCRNYCRMVCRSEFYSKEIHIRSLYVCVRSFALISPLFDTFTFMAVYAGVAAAFPASYRALVSVLAIERVGMGNFPAAFSIIYVFMSITSLICQPIAGWMADYYGSWYPAFTLTGISLICASVTLLLEPVVRRYGICKTCFTENVDNELASRVKVNGAYIQDSNEGILKNADTAETDLP